MVQVEHGRLRALEEDGPVAVENVPAELRRVGDVRLQPVAVGDVLLDERVEVETCVDLRLGRAALLELLALHLELVEGVAVLVESGEDLLAQDLLVEQILNADPDPRGLVGVAGADPAAGGADLELAQLQLARRVQEHVVGHDQVCVGRDAQAADVDAALAQPVDLAGQHARVDYDAVPDRADLAGVEDPRRGQVELERLAVADDCVPGVVAALEADDYLGTLRQQVDDLAFALIAPLGADYDLSRHKRGL